MKTIVKIKGIDTEIELTEDQILSIRSKTEYRFIEVVNAIQEHASYLESECIELGESRERLNRFLCATSYFIQGVESALKQNWYMLDSLHVKVPTPLLAEMKYLFNRHSKD